MQVQVLVKHHMDMTSETLVGYDGNKMFFIGFLEEVKKNRWVVSIVYAG